MNWQHFYTYKPEQLTETLATHVPSLCTRILNALDKDYEQTIWHALQFTVGQLIYNQKQTPDFQRQDPTDKTNLLVTIYNNIENSYHQKPEQLQKWLDGINFYTKQTDFAYIWRTIKHVEIPIAAIENEHLKNILTHLEKRGAQLHLKAVISADESYINQELQKITGIEPKDLVNIEHGDFTNKLFPIKNKLETELRIRNISRKPWARRVLHD